MGMSMDLPLKIFIQLGVKTQLLKNFVFTP